MSSEGQNGKENQKLKKNRHWLRNILLVCFIAGLLGIAALGVIFFSFGSYDDALLHDDPLTTLLYDSQEELILGVHGSQNRVYVSIENMPTYLTQAFLAAEDLRFYSHPGFDPVRIAGALWADIKAGNLAQGASTITQQLVKNTHLTAEKTWTRKLKEVWYAFQIERVYSKDEILEMYMNHVYFGNGAYGVQAAAQAYFGVDVEELTLPQSASLAATLKAPSNYAPHIQPDNNKRRRDSILTTMREEEMISEADYRRATAQAVSVAEEKDSLSQHGWFTDAALEQAQTLLGIEYDELLSDGYHIYTTMDSYLQTACEELFADAALFPENAEDGTLCQAAAVVVDSPTGRIRAIIGGREYTTRRGLNRALRARRQPGSTLKPFAVFAPAIERFGYTTVTVLEDVQTDFDGYTPRNYGNTYRGAVTLRTALARSINIPAVHVLNSIGIPAGLESAARFGITLDPNDGYLPLALGSMTYGATPLEMASAYGALGTDGTVHPAYLIERIQDAQGMTVYRAQPQPQKAVEASTAYIMTDILRSAATWGTANKLGATGIEVAGKTGTVAFEGDLNRDAWTCAYTPQTSITVWMGFDTTDMQHAMGKPVTGGALPAQLAAEILLRAQPESVPFASPTNVEQVPMDRRALENELRALRATDITPASETVQEVFLPGTAPTQYSDYWAVPQPPSDFRVTQGLSNMPLISFTIRDSFARYRLYRESDGQTLQLTAFKGEAGQSIQYSDLDAQRRTEYIYYLVPEHAEAVDYGMQNAIGPSTNRAIFRVSGFPFDLPFDFDDLFSGRQQSAMTPSPTPAATPRPTMRTPTPIPSLTAAPTPTPTPTPTPDNSPLFGFR